MAKLDKDVEEEILAIVEKYQKENTKLLKLAELYSNFLKDTLLNSIITPPFRN